MTNATIGELGAVVIAAAMIPGFLFWLQETRQRNRYLRTHKRRHEMKIRRERSGNIHHGRLSNDLSAC